MDTVQWSKSVLLDSSEPPQEEQGELWLTHGGAMTFLATWKEEQGELWVTPISNHYFNKKIQYIPNDSHSIPTPKSGKNY